VSLLAFIFLIPFFLSLLYLIKGRFDLAFLNVYLPCLLLLPSYYFIRLPHLPPESAAEWALFPLGIVLLVAHRRWPPLRRMDVWVVLFMSSLGASELLRETSFKDGLAFFANTFVQMFFAYLVGRCLIEPDLRVPTVKRIVLLFLCLTPAILWEYRMGQNPWISTGYRIFHFEVGPFVQIREGHARVQACFGHAILAGIMFFIVFLLNASLGDIYKRDKLRLGPLFSTLERYHVPAILLLLFLLLTRSRGPMIGAAVGYSILQIPRFRNIKIAATVVALLLVVAGVLANSYFNKYTKVTDVWNESEEQSSAAYRRDLANNYKRITETGGWLGWGALSFPKVPGQSSIDNNYLLVQLSQGKIGLYLFLLIAAESVFAAGRSAFTFRARESRFFAFVCVGALSGLFLSLYTVYLGDQVVQVSFLLLGWSQSLQDTGEVDLPAAEKYHFKRVFA
jgi:O-Antigen ligase